MREKLLLVESKFLNTDNDLILQGDLTTRATFS